MGANLSTPEKIAKLARQGDAQSLEVRSSAAGAPALLPPASGICWELWPACPAQGPTHAACSCRSPAPCPAPAPCALPAGLQALLTDLQRNDSSYAANRTRYLESTDDHGNTPLTAAAARGHLPVVRVVRVCTRVSACGGTGGLLTTYAGCSPECLFQLSTEGGLSSATFTASLPVASSDARAALPPPPRSCCALAPTYTTST